MDVAGIARPVILMVDDDERLLASVRRTLSGCFTFVTFTDGEQALDWLVDNKDRLALIIADLIMPAIDGMSFLKRACQMAPNVPRILLSGNLSTVSLHDAIEQAMVARVLAKPVSIAVLREVIERVIRFGKPVDKNALCVTPEMVDLAIDHGDIKTVLQPRYRASDRAFCGMEILCRMSVLQKDFTITEIFEACWQDPVIDRLTIELMAHMMDQVQRYRVLLGDAANISVNLSGQSVRNAEFLNLVIRFFEKMRMRGVTVSFEVPERQLRPGDQAFFMGACRLRERGIALFIDDFGSGNNSLELLRSEVFAGIKLDRELVQGTATDLLDGAFVEWITRVCCNLGLSIAAKGVENRKQLERLAQYGVSEFQGFYLGEPASLTDWEMADRKVGYAPAEG